MDKLAKLTTDIGKLWETYSGAYFTGIRNTLVLAVVATLIGCVIGLLCGALAGSILPLSIRTALGVMLYGMFIAIVVPPAKKNRDIFVAVVLALIFSSLFSWTPGLKTRLQISSTVHTVMRRFVRFMSEPPDAPAGFSHPAGSE